MTAATDLSTAEVLRRAKQRLETHGWRPDGGPIADDGPCCAYQAVNLAYADAQKIPITIAEVDLYNRLLRYLNRALGFGDTKMVSLLWQWNDRQKSVEPVLAAFDRAIALAEEQDR